MTIRVLVAEDSMTARELLVEILRSDPGIEVVGEARNGVEAVEMTRTLHPDVVTMDIRMPRMDGFEATRQIMIEAPTPIVIVSTSLDVTEIAVSLDALRAGALAVFPKPRGPGAASFEDDAQRFLDTVKAMSAVKVVRRWRRPDTAPARPSYVSSGVRPRVVALAASTGGPAALARILAGLRADFPLPILAVQHIATGFVDGLAAWLDRIGTLRVKVAEDGEALRPRTLYLAPDDRHLELRDPATVALSTAAPVGGFRPSASHLFESVARACGGSSIALILTGMGDDGVAGLRAVRASGGTVIAQDQDSSAVFGMPAAAVEAGLAEIVLPLGGIADRLEELV